MEKKRNSPASPRRQWRFLRLAILLARKGGAFKQRVLLDIRLLPSYLKKLGRTDAADRLCYRERQFSFDDTPAFHFKMHRPASLRLPRIPCITPSVNFDDDEEIFIERCTAMKLLEEEGDDILDAETPMKRFGEGKDIGEGGEDEIDSRAERFIVEFYEQMKLQRQISNLEFNEMIRRGMSC